QLDRTERARWVAGGRTPVSVLRLAGGVVLAVVGVLLLVSQGASMSATINAAVAAVAVLLATREALLNAARHGSPPVTVYLEASEDRVEVFVRDRGEGFDIAAIPHDRF